MLEMSVAKVITLLLLAVISLMVICLVCWLIVFYRCIVLVKMVMIAAITIGFFSMIQNVLV